MRHRYTIEPDYQVGSPQWAVQERGEGDAAEEGRTVARLHDYTDACRFIEAQERGGAARERALRRLEAPAKDGPAGPDRHGKYGTNGWGTWGVIRGRIGPDGAPWYRAALVGGRTSGKDVVRTFQPRYLDRPETEVQGWEPWGEVRKRAQAFAEALNSSGARRERALRGSEE